MLSLHNRQVFLCCSRVDLRKSFNGLSGIVLSSFGCDPRSGDAFVFVSKRGNLLKVLVWDRDGFWCCAKRLPKGTFRVPALGAADGSLCAITISVSDWELLLAGIIVKDKSQAARIDISAATKVV